MDHITGKLTRPGDFKSKKEIEKEKKEKEKMIKQKVREELLAPTPVSDVDTRLYSDSLAATSSKSKSEVEIAEDKQKAENKRQAKAEADRQKLAEIQEQNKQYQAMI
mmetsp:Transcript_2069/g.3118  ORF Transcript_2069/g.3118 Transcript_2069/m.3118 type:complete len:107 (+) Transcript_2069:1298-1618(+)